MNDMYISLLYPTAEAEAEHYARGERVADEEVCRQLGLSALLGLRRGSPALFFSLDPTVLTFRQRMLADLAAVPAAGEALREVTPMLSDILELRRLDERTTRDGDAVTLYGMTEIELYVSVVSTLRERLEPLAPALTSEAFGRLVAFVLAASESEYFLELKAALAKLTSRMLEVRSLTVGVNLDAQLRPTDAGIVSVNAERYHAGTTLDKILRMSFKPDGMTCVASLAALGKPGADERRDNLSRAVLDALADVFKSSVRGWQNVARRYVLENTDALLRILPEIEFAERAAALERALGERGCPLSAPVFRPMGEKALSAKGLCNPDIVLRGEGTVVRNDFAFDDEARIYVITGPNRGGKSVCTVAVGLAQAMAQLGMRVAAESCEISPVDRILIHFPQGAEDTIDKGRLGEECARLREMMEELSPDSLLLLDESLSSTGAYEAAYIAADILLGFGRAGCRCVFSTHLHELAARAPALSAASKEAGGVGIDTLVAEVEPDGTRTFRVTRGRPDGKSYARDVAARYGLGDEQINDLLRHIKDAKQTPDVTV
ncbi:MAG: hypothetical protein J6125_03765 [Clostridia bacterium]|nr:hypothetical protein [Clostridia bacterium]